MSEVLNIPQDCFKFLIGTKGATMKDIEARSGASLTINDKVTVKGSGPQIQKAKDIIFTEILKGKVFSLSVTVQVPPHLHKYIIGTKAATLKDIETRTSSKVEVPKSGSDVVVQANSQKDADAAVAMIKAIVAENSSKVDEATAFKKEYPIIEYIHKYILGPNGKTADEVKTKTATAIRLEPTKLIIFSHTESNIPKAYSMLEARLKELGWFYTPSKGWYEDNPNDALFKAARGEAEKHAAKRAELMQQSRKAYDNKDGAGAKKFSEQAKEEEKKMIEANARAAKLIFEWKNKAFDDYTIDLHGLLVEEAMQFVQERVEALKASKKRERNTLDIITGAGNHSETTAKIRPAVAKYLSTQKIKFVEANNGTFTATL